jgi:hypothetical protein
MGAATYAVRNKPIFVSMPIGAVTYASMVLALRIVSPKELTALRDVIRGRGKTRARIESATS